jgi:hypothetical protein
MGRYVEPAATRSAPPSCTQCGTTRSRTPQVISTGATGALIQPSTLRPGSSRLRFGIRDSTGHRPPQWSKLKMNRLLWRFRSRHRASYTNTVRGDVPRSAACVDICGVRIYGAPGQLGCLTCFDTVSEHRSDTASTARMTAIVFHVADGSLS